MIDDDCGIPAFSRNTFCEHVNMVKPHFTSLFYFFLTLSWVKQSKTIGKPQSVGSQKHVKTWTILVTQGSQSFCRRPCPVVLPGPAPRSPDASSDRTISWLWKTIKVVPHLTFGGYGKRLYIIYINRTSGVKLNKHNWGTTFGCYHLLS